MKSTDGVYVSQGASEKLLSDIRRLAPAVRAKVREGKRHRDSCDANAEAWAAALRAAGYSADTVCDGVAELDSPIWHEDSGEMRDRIGHDWCVVDDAGKKIIVDGAIRQFKGQIPAYNGSVWEAVIHPQRFWFKGDAHEPKPLKDTDVIRVYHGFNDFNEFLAAIRHGISGKARASRRYSYENNNNPRGLFVTANLSVAKEFTGGGKFAGIIEFHAKVSDLEAPVWPSGSYTVQGGMEQYFDWDNHHAEREAARLAAREDAIEFAKKQAGYFDYVLHSDRPELARLLYVSREAQALFTGDLNPNMIRSVWVREADRKSGYQLTTQAFTRMSRTEVLRKFKHVSSDAQSRGYGPADKLYLPAEDWKGKSDFIIRIATREGNPSRKTIEFYQNALDDVTADNLERMLGIYMWPKQIEQAKASFAPVNEDGRVITGDYSQRGRGLLGHG